MSAAGVGLLLRSLKLPGFVRAYAEVAEQAERQGWGFERYLQHLAEIEIEERRVRRIDRLQRSSGLTHDKTLATLELGRLPAPVRRSLPSLYEGGFVDPTLTSCPNFGSTSGLGHRPQAGAAWLPRAVPAGLQAGAAATGGQA